MPNYELSDNQKSFVHEFIKTDNKREAMRRSSYKTDKFTGGMLTTAAAKLLAVPKVIEYMEKLTGPAKKKAEEKIQEEIDISIEANQTRILSAYDIAETAKDPRGMIAAVAELNKMKGYHAPKKLEVDDLSKKTDEELDEELEKAKASLNGQAR